MPPQGKRKNAFPQNDKEFCIAAADAFARDGHTVLVYPLCFVRGTTPFQCAPAAFATAAPSVSYASAFICLNGLAVYEILPSGSITYR